MSDLIDRQAAIEKTEMLYRDVRDDTSYMLIGYNHALSDMRAILKALPTVDAVERKKGKWIKVGDSSYKCSVCGFLLKWQREVCPNCGADMRKETENAHG